VLEGQVEQRRIGEVCLGEERVTGQEHHDHVDRSGYHFVVVAAGERAQMAGHTLRVFREQPCTLDRVVSGGGVEVAVERDLGVEDHAPAIGEVDDGVRARHGAVRPAAEAVLLDEVDVLLHAAALEHSSQLHLTPHPAGLVVAHGARHAARLVPNLFIGVSQSLDGVLQHGRLALPLGVELIEVPRELLETSGDGLSLRLEVPGHGVTPPSTSEPRAEGDPGDDGEHEQDDPGEYGGDDGGGVHAPMLPMGCDTEAGAGDAGGVWNRSRRRRERQERLDAGFPDEWRTLCERRFRWYQRLDAEQRARFERRVLEMVLDVSWEPARGFEITDEMRVTVASLAQLVALELPDGALGRVHAVVMHPTTIVMEGEHSQVAGVVSDEPTAILGEAIDGGPILLAWDEVVDDVRHPRRGRNVVIHEFAHVIDMLDGVVDGTPPITDPDAAQRWITVCTDVFEQVVEGRAGHALDPYAGVNPGEFFAVATEAYFCDPIALQREHPELFTEFRAVYGLDPRTWAVH